MCPLDTCAYRGKTCDELRRVFAPQGDEVCRNPINKVQQTGHDPNSAIGTKRKLAPLEPILVKAGVDVFDDLAREDADHYNSSIRKPARV